MKDNNPLQHIPRSNGNVTALERLKMIQAQFKARWVGINTEFTGRPGTSLMCNETRNFPMTQQEHEEILRNERFQRIFDTLRNIENDMPLLLVNTNERTRSGSNFFNGKNAMNKSGREDNKDQGLSSYLYIAPPSNTLNQIVKIKPINKQQL